MSHIVVAKLRHLGCLVFEWVWFCVGVDGLVVLGWSCLLVGDPWWAAASREVQVAINLGIELRLDLSPGQSIALIFRHI